MPDELIIELERRQPLLAAINLCTASLLAFGLVHAAPAPTLAAWFAYMLLVQASRVLWLVRRATTRLNAVGWLVAASAAAGIGWGLTGALFASVGSPAQQMLVPFFLAGMAAGAVATLAGHLLVLFAFLLPTLLPYAMRLALNGEPASRTMALATLAYAAGLSAVGYRINRSLRRSAALHIENARLVNDLDRARRGLEVQVKRRGAELEAVMETVPVAVWLVHDPRAERITGNHRAAEILRLEQGSNLSFTTAPWELPRQFRVFHDDQEVLEADLPLQRAARGEPVWNEELRLVFGDGAHVDLLISAATVRDSMGNPTGAVGAAVDITERKRTEERIKYLAHHDQLTGLPNRLLLQDRLRQALALARRDASSIALLLLDLDHFKDINDALGHPSGDSLLRVVVERLAASMRPSDTLARLGGDEFAVVQLGLRGPDGAAVLAQRLIDALDTPFTLEEQEVHVSASVGVAVFPGDSEYADELVRQADLALYRAKQDGRGRTCFFDPAMDADVRARRKLEAELRQAIDRGEFTLHYQPQLDLRTDRVDSVEALVRWHHPERGLVLPGEFIPVAEASGLVRPLGAWVLQEACRQARAWQDAGLPVMVAVNLSPAQLRHDRVLQDIDDALGSNLLEPRWLELEITESLFLELSEAATNRTLTGLADRGIRLALDDFGTGYSSLAVLKSLPVTKLKIDYCFIHDIDRDPDNAAVVQAIVDLGHALGKRVVAEGVERDVQLSFVRRLGCDAAQGFLFARPQVAAEVGHLIEA